MRKAVLLCAYAAVCSCMELRGQEKIPSDLDPVTITTSLTPEKSSRTGRNVFVIRGEQIAALPVHSFDELLRYLPGVEIQSRGPYGAQSDIIMRGGTFQQVLVILDGLRLNDPATGHFTGYLPLAPSEIDRIEILKGASSAIYGSEAVGGVIHIISKTFAARQGVWKSQLQAQVTAGANNLLSVNAGGFFSNGRTAINAGVLSNNTSGEPQRGTSGSVYGHTVSFSLSHQVTEKFSIRMRYAYEDRKFAAQNFYTSFLSDTASERVVNFWNQISLNYTVQKHRISLNAGYKDLQDEYAYNPSSAANRNNSKLIQIALTDVWKVNNRASMVWGGQFLSKRIASNDRGVHRIDQYAGFGVLNLEIGTRGFLSPAVRLEWNERWGWEFIPQLNASYGTEKFRLRASGGKTIRDGDFTERFNNYGKSWVTGGRIGNPDLQVERSLSYEAGADYFGLRNLKISAGFFRRHHQDLIDYVVTPYAEMPRRINLSPTGSYALARNIAGFITSGLETELVYARSLKNNSSISGTMGFTWISSNTEGEPSFYISSHARLLGNFIVQYSCKKLTAVISGLYKKRNSQPVQPGIVAVAPSYFLLNARVEGNIVRNKLSIFIQGDNLLNKEYADLLGAPMPGRWLMAGFKISLSKNSDDARPFGTTGNYENKWWYLNRK